MGYKLILSKTLLRLHKIFYTPSNDNLLQSVEQTTSDLNAVGVRRRHTLPGLLVVLIRLRLAFLTRLQEVTWFHNHLAT